MLPDDSEGSGLRRVTPCVCTGQEVEFECVVVGDGGTYWQGTALQGCTNGRILIRHSTYGTGYTYREQCSNTGWVVSYPLSAVGNSYTSRLVIQNVTQHLNESSIECTSNTGVQIGQIPVILSTGNYSLM